MKKILDILKGIAIGIANVIPGFSGGTMAVIFKVYERLIGAASDFIHHPLKVIKDVWALVVGIVVGVIGASFTIIYALNSFPMQTIMFFVGLIIGSIPFIYTNMKGYNVKVRLLPEIISFIVGLSIVVVLPIINVRPNIGNINFFTYLMIFLMGIISAGAMIIPGISGSLVLMIFGYYILIVDNLKGFITSLIHFDFSGLGLSFIIIFVFAIGCIIGFFSIAKLINYLFKKCPRIVYATILGLLFGSVFSITYTTAQDYSDKIDFSSPWLYIVSSITLIIGIVAAYLMAKYDKNKEKNIEIGELEGEESENS